MKEFFVIFFMLSSLVFIGFADFLIFRIGSIFQIIVTIIVNWIFLNGWIYTFKMIKKEFKK